VWLALDDCDDANGCIRVVPGSQDWPVLCPTPADPELSFTQESLPLPDDVAQLPVEMRAGDVLFFNGSLVHGSLPNVTADRFRRSLIAHFIEERATGSVDWIQPVLHPTGASSGWTSATTAAVPAARGSSTTGPGRSP
jgi:ectoine hydroxylase-related dioxygenase (phytanoyl-CoA dioxygenase family)